MNLPESWLRSFCNPPIPGAELAERLTMAGVEVEAYEPVGPRFSGVVVAQILEVARHPNADQLTVCTLDAGGEKLKVVCGAPNVRVSMKAPLARIGAQLPGISVQKTTIRGVESAGMLCSAKELGLSDDHSGVLELNGKVGSDARGALGLDERVLTLKLTPNRADCLSVLGVAREVTALTGAKLEAPRIEPVPAKSQARHAVKISAPEGCGRFAGRVIRNVNAAAPTPAWMKSRLEQSGQRSISALVDVTNYVMLELGRPLHVYDLDKLRGAIDVRWGRKGEKVLLLNEQTVEVDPSVLCITDDSGVIGLGGIMGGETTKADAPTKNIFLESAFFWPDAIMGRSRKYGFTSDAGHRFERGVDFNNNVDGIERATRLIVDICGGEPGPTEDLVAKLPARPPVKMRVARAQKVIGMQLAADEMQKSFERLGLPHERDKDSFTVKPPSYRFDLAIEEDLIEEVARLYGFERIAAHPPRPAATFPQLAERRSLHDLRERLAAAEYREVVNFTFVEPQWELDFAGEANPVRLLNPIASQQSVMRTSLIGSLVSNLRFRGRARLHPRRSGEGRAARGTWPAPADARGGGGVWTRAGRAVGRKDTPGRLLRCQGGPGGPDQSARRALRARRASGAPSRPRRARVDRRRCSRLDRRIASALAAEIRARSAGGAVRTRCRAVAGGEGSAVQRPLQVPAGGAGHGRGGRFGGAGPGPSGRDGGEKTADRGFDKAL